MLFGCWGTPPPRPPRPPRLPLVAPPRPLPLPRPRLMNYTQYDDMTNNKNKHTNKQTNKQTKVVQPGNTSKKKHQKKTRENKGGGGKERKKEKKKTHAHSKEKKTSDEKQDQPDKRNRHHTAPLPSSNPQTYHGPTIFLRVPMLAVSLLSSPCLIHQTYFIHTLIGVILETFQYLVKDILGMFTYNSKNPIKTTSRKPIL